MNIQEQIYKLVEERKNHKSKSKTYTKISNSIKALRKKAEKFGSESIENNSLVNAVQYTTDREQENVNFLVILDAAKSLVENDKPELAKNLLSTLLD